MIGSSPIAVRATLEGLLERPDLSGVAEVAPEVVALACDDRRLLHGAFVQASSRAVHDWLGNWSVLTSGSRPSGELKAKVLTYADRLSARYTLGAFSGRTCEAAAMRFTEMPSYADLCAFLDGEMAKIRERDRRLGLVIAARKAQSESAPRYSEYPPEKRREIDGMFQQMYRNLGVKSGAPR